MNTEIAWHYTTMSTFEQILKCGKIKSRALLISEKLQQRPDWDVIRRDSAALAAVLPEYMKDKNSFLRRKPIVWFSRQRDWEQQAGELTEIKDGNWSEPDYSLPPRQLSKMETYRQGGGLVRLGLAEEKLQEIERLYMTEYSLDYAAKAILVDRLCLGGINKKHVMGYLGESVPLDQADALDVFFPDDPDAEDGKGMWIPLPWPLELSLDRVLSFVESLQSHLREAQKGVRSGSSDTMKREDSNGTTKVVSLDCHRY